MMAETDQILNPEAWKQIRGYRFYYDAPPTGEYLERAVRKICNAYVRYLEKYMHPVLGTNFEATAIRAQEVKLEVFRAPA